MGLRITGQTPSFTDAAQLRTTESRSHEMPALGCPDVGLRIHGRDTNTNRGRWLEPLEPRHAAFVANLRTGCHHRYRKSIAPASRDRAGSERLGILRIATESGY